MAEQAESEKIYQQRLKQETLKTFIDVPEKIEKITVTKSTESSISFEWTPPEQNNSEITLYKIYLKQGSELTL